MALARLPSNFGRIRDVAQLPVGTLTLGQLMRNTRPDPESLLAVGRWLHAQLPIRLARRIEDCLQLPHVVVSNPHINQVLSNYLSTFDAVSAFPEIRTPEDEAAFCSLVKEELSKHLHGTRQIAEGYRQVRQAYPHIHLDGFLNNFFVARIASRILMENYVQMREPREGYVGVVRQGMRPLCVLQGLAGSLEQLTREMYSCAPAVIIQGNLDCLLDYIPRHVWCMVRELLKNALRATAERHCARRAGDQDARLPPVVVELQQGDVHVIIKISDQGGGMAKDVQQLAWKYGWTTADDRTPGSRLDLAGYGFGLPLTRLHAQYFGGDLFMQAIPGHGTNMYLLLTHLKEGTPSTEIDDLSTVLYREERGGRSA